MGEALNRRDYAAAAAETGKGSGIELERNDASITELRDGKVVRTAYYSDRAQALAAAGVSE
jgi:ketosteroid isomerase-like protein